MDAANALATYLADASAHGHDTADHRLIAEVQANGGDFAAWRALRSSEGFPCVSRSRSQRREMWARVESKGAAQWLESFHAAEAWANTDFASLTNELAAAKEMIALMG